MPDSAEGLEGLRGFRVQGFHGFNRTLEGLGMVLQFRHIRSVGLRFGSRQGAGFEGTGLQPRGLLSFNFYMSLFEYRSPSRWAPEVAPDV